MSNSQPNRAPASSSPDDRIKQLEAEAALYRHALEKSREEMQAFAYSVSHDLRAPLRAIEGFSKILLEDYSKEFSEDAGRFLQHIIGNTQQLSSQIEDLLRFYRLGKNPPQRIMVQAADIAREAWEELKPADRSVAFHLHPLPQTFADPVMLRQVFSQLFSNALKFSAPNPEPSIEVTFRQEKGNTTFTVRDNGVGFDPNHAQKLFQVFQKMHSPQEFPGNGIGLAIIKRLVEAHGGCVWAEAEPDKGAAFSFEIPGPPA